MIFYVICVDFSSFSRKALLEIFDRLNATMSMKNVYQMLLDKCKHVIKFVFYLKYMAIIVYDVYLLCRC